MRVHRTSLGHRVVVPFVVATALALTMVAGPTAPTTAAQGVSTASAGLGTTWTDRSSQFSGNNWSGVAYGKGIFVAASGSGSTGAGHRIMRSIDGVTWTRSALAGAEGVSVAFGDDTFVSVMQNGRVYASPDGIQWTFWDQGVGPSNGWQGVTYGDGRFLSVAYSGPYPSARSTNGVNWTFAGLPYLTPVTGGWESAAFGDDTFVAVESSRVAYATDDTWTVIAAAKTANWSSVTYGAGLFVAVSDDSVMTSPNGRTWTLQTAAEKNDWSSVTYAAGMFVAVSSNGTNRVMTSTDGVSWTAQTAPLRAWRSITYGNGGFVAVGDAGAVMTSGISTGVSPALDSAVRTPDGFTVNVTNYDPAYTWTPTVDTGSVTAGTATGGTLPLTVTGLGAAGAATLTVTTARTGFSSGSAIATRPAVAPPGAPTLTAITPGDGQASVQFDPPVSDGGSPVTWVEFALDDTTTVDDSTTGPSPHSLSGLANGRTYVVYARAVNTAGPGPWTPASAPFTPQAPPPPPVFPPGEPEGVLVVAGNASATVAWSAPTASGSFPVTNYQVESVPGAGTCLTSGLTCAITGLRNGTAYSFRARALSGAGWGPWSAPSNEVTPRPPVNPPSITITGSRDGREARVAGMIKGAVDSSVTAWVRLPGRSAYAPEGRATVQSDGTFTWRRLTSKTVYVYFRTASGLRSDRIVIAVA